MTVSQLSESEIEAHYKQRAEIEAVATMVGLKVDEDNWPLMRALSTIAHEQRGGTKGEQKPGAETQQGEPGPQLAAARRAVADLRAVTSKPQATSTEDMGMVVLNRMRRSRGLPPIDAKAGR